MKFSIPVIALLACWDVATRAQGTALHTDATGFECTGENTDSRISFNINLRKKVIEWESGDTNKIVVSDNQVSVYRDPYIAIYSKHAHGRYLNRTTLVYTDIMLNKESGENNSISYICKIVPMHVFGSHRKF